MSIRLFVFITIENIEFQIMSLTGVKRISTDNDRFWKCLIGNLSLYYFACNTSVNDYHCTCVLPLFKSQPQTV